MSAFLDWLEQKKKIDPALAQQMKTPLNRDSIGTGEYAVKKLASGTAGIASALSRFGEGAAGYAGLEDVSKGFQGVADIFEQQQQKLDWESGGQQTAFMGQDSLLEKGRRGELELGDVGSYVSDLALTQLPQYALGIGAAKLGVKALGPAVGKLAPKLSERAVHTIAGAAGTTGAMAAQETGSIYGEQEEKNFLKALAYGVPASALETAGMAYGMGKMGVGKYIDDALAPTFKRSAKEIGIDVLKSTASEGLTESAQNVLEQSGARAGWDVAGDLAATDWREVAESGLAGGVMGGGTTAALAPITNRNAPQDPSKIQTLREKVVAEAEAKALQAQQEGVQGVQKGVQSTSLLNATPTMDEAKQSLREAAAAQQGESEVQAFDAGIEAGVEGEFSFKPEINQASELLNAEPYAITSIARMSDSPKAFSENLSSTFGETAKKIALVLWNKLKEERGSFSLLDKHPNAVLFQNANIDLYSKKPTTARIEQLREAYQQETDPKTKDAIKKLGNEYRSALLSPTIPAQDKQQAVEDYRLAESVVPIDTTEQDRLEKIFPERQRENLKFEKNKDFEEKEAPPIPAFEQDEDPTLSAFDRGTTVVPAVHENERLHRMERNILFENQKRFGGVKEIKAVAEDELAAFSRKPKALRDSLQKKGEAPSFDTASARVAEQNKKTLSAVAEQLGKNETLSVQTEEGVSAASIMVGLLENLGQRYDLSTVVKKIKKETGKQNLSQLEEIPQTLFDLEEYTGQLDNYLSGQAEDTRSEQAYEDLKDKEARFSPFLKKVEERLTKKEKARYAPAMLRLIKNPDVIATYVGNEMPWLINRPLEEVADESTGEVYYKGTENINYKDLAFEFSALLGKMKSRDKAPELSPDLARTILNSFLEGELDSRGGLERLIERTEREDLKAKAEEQYKKMHDKRLPKVRKVKKAPTTPQTNEELDAVVASGKAEVKDGVYYINEDIGVDRIAGTRSDGSVYVIVPFVKDLYEGKEEAIKKAGEFTASTLDRLGIKIENVKDTFKTEQQFLGFIVRRELTHLKYQDKESTYEVELRASFSALSPEQQKSLRLRWWKESVESKSLATKYLPYYFGQLQEVLMKGRWNKDVVFDFNTTKEALSWVKNVKGLENFQNLSEAQQETIAKELHRNLWLENEFASSPRLKSVLDYKDAELVLNDILGYGPNRKRKAQPKPDVSKAFQEMPYPEQVEIVKDSLKSYYYNNDLGHDYFPMSYIKNHLGSTQYSHLAEAMDELRNAPGIDKDTVEYDVIDRTRENIGSFDLFQENKKGKFQKFYYQNTVLEIFERLKSINGDVVAASLSNEYDRIVQSISELYAKKNFGMIEQMYGKAIVPRAGIIAALDNKDISPEEKYMSVVRAFYGASYERGRFTTQERHATRLVLYSLMVPAKAALAYQAYVNRTILDKDLFKKLSEHYKELNMNESDMFDLFINAGSNPTTMTAMLREKKRVVKHKEIDTFFAKLTDQRGKMDASAARKAVLSFLEKDNHKAFEEYAKDFSTKKLTPEQANLFEALYQYEVQLKKPADVVSVADKSILLERGKEKRMAEEKGDDLASFLRSKGIEVPIEYQYAEKQEYTDFERSLAAEGAAVVVARSSWMEKIFEGIAKAFNADLVLTAGDYRSRYFPSSKDGKAKIVLNVSDKKAMPKVFAHELFHHVVAKALPAQYRAFQKAIADLYGMDTQFFDEERLAEVFAEAVGEREFWDHLAKTIPGQTLGQKLAISLVKTVRSLWSSFHRPSDFFESHFAKDQMEPIYKLVADMVGHAYTRRLENPNSDEVKFYTPLGAATMQEVEAARKVAGNVFKGVWGKIFKPGTKTRQQFAENIHNLFVDMKAFYVKHRPRFAYADLGVDPAIRTLAHQIRNGWKVDANLLHNTVVKKHKPSFDNAATAYRNKVKAEIDAGKYVIGRDNTNKPIYLDASTKAGAEFARTIVAEAKRKYFEKMHDDLVRGQVDVTTQEGKEEAGRLGYGTEIIEALTAYKEASDAIYARMVEFYPELEYNPAHYGQSIRWRNPSGDFVHSDIDWFTNPEFSKLEGNKRMLKPKDFDRTTEQIAKEEKKVYDTIDPSQLFLNYVSDAYKLIHFKDAIDKGSSAANPSVQWFSSTTAALKEGFVPVKDNAAKIFQVLNRTEGFKVLEINLANPDKQTYAKDRNGNEMMFSSHRDAGKWLMAQMFNPNVHRQVVPVSKDVEPVVKGWRAVFRNERGEKAIAREFPLEKTAKDWLDEHAGEYAASYPYVEPIFGYARTAEAGQLYFHPDFADMLNVLLAKDRIRANKYGRLLVGVKNVWTSIEFAVSLFHAFTIMQETVAAKTAWQQLKNRDNGVFSLGSSLRYFNPKTAFNENAKIARLFKEIMHNPDSQDSVEKAKLEELLQTKDVDFVDAVKQFFLAGGLEGLDPTLQSHFHSMGNMRYTDPSGRISFKAMADSINEVFQSELEKSPDHPLMAYLRTAGFAATEGTSAWLMEGVIPNMKLAAWLSEYTMFLEQNAESLQNGTVTKEELARKAIFFVEDRFGEVNWDNAWMNPTFKTVLQIMFRSYTWFTGSFTAFGKAGIDLAKMVSYKAQGKQHKLGPEAYWARNASVAHILTVVAIAGAYTIGAALTSGEEAETPEDTPLLTKLLFPRVDKYDPTRRIAIPSYITEGWKILSHTGSLSSEAEYTKLVSGRFSSLLGKSFELFKNEDWRGTIIANPNDNIIKQTADRLWHIAPTPIMVSAVTRQTKEKGFDPKEIGFGLMGIAEAPAAAKRSAATNVAYDIRRNEFRGMKITPEEMAEKNVLKRAMYAYQKGDNSKINALLKEGKVSQTQFKNAVKRLPVIMNKKNPQYEDQLTSALKQMTMDGALEVWEKMSDTEKKKHKPELFKKYSNLVARSSRSPEYKAAIKEKMKEAGIIR